MISREASSINDASQPAPATSENTGLSRANNPRRAAPPRRSRRPRALRPCLPECRGHEPAGWPCRRAVAPRECLSLVVDEPGHRLHHRAVAAVDQDEVRCPPSCAQVLASPSPSVSRSSKLDVLRPSRYVSTCSRKLVMVFLARYRVHNYECALMSAIRLLSRLGPTPLRRALQLCEAHVYPVERSVLNRFLRGRDPEESVKFLELTSLVLSLRLAGATARVPVATASRSQSSRLALRTAMHVRVDVQRLAVPGEGNFFAAARAARWAALRTCLASSRVSRSPAA